jgi:signal peptidase II
MKNFRRAVVLCLLLVATAGCDQVTKRYAITELSGAPDQSFLGDTFRLQYHENAGAFLSLGADWRPETRVAVFQVANGLVLLAIAMLALRSHSSRLGALGLGLILGGGVSNLIDRVAFGKVVDFLNVGIGSLRTGIFNVADVAVLAGAVCLIWEASRNSYTPSVSTRRP